MNTTKNFIKGILLLTMFFVVHSCAEDKLSMEGTGSIKGVVLDESNSEPVANAEITTNPPSQSVLTDSAGHFVMEDVEVGDYNVIAKKRDYFSATTNIKVNNNATTHVVINFAARTSEQDLPEFTNSFYPADQQNNVSVNPRFSWKVKNLSDTTDFQLTLFHEGQSIAVQMKNPTDTFAQVNGLKFGTTYLWQLLAQNNTGKVYTEIRTFTTQEFPTNFFVYAKRDNDIAQLFLSDTTAAGNIQLTHNNFHSWRPLMNPKKDHMAFLSTRDLQPDLYVMDADGINIKKVSSVPTGGYYNKGVGFSWLPDGERLVFSSYNKLYTIRRDGTNLVQLTSISPEKHFREVDWSPTNNKIVALTLGVDRYDAEIILMNTDGSGKEVIVGGLIGALENPVFSIDGKKILYTYDVSDFQSIQGRQLDAHIFEYDIESGVAVDMSTHKPNGTNDLQPQYSDNGAYIQFVNTQNTLGSSRHLWTMPVDNTGSQSRNKVIDNIEAPDW